MAEEKPEQLELRLYRNDSEEARNIERQLRERGYKLKIVLDSAPEPRVYSACFFAKGYQQICAIFGAHPRG